MKTIRNVTMVVKLFTKSCHGWENSKNGPLAAHPSNKTSARMKAQDVPAKKAIFSAKRRKTLFMNESNRACYCGNAFIFSRVFIHRWNQDDAHALKIRTF